jgi:Integrase core domain
MTGTAWAIDYTFPLRPIDGTHPAILTIRDLASGCILLAEPCRAADAAHVVFHLHQLIQAHGAPLVLKADNGSHFTAAPVSALLQRHRIVPLFSPVYTPAFNGAIEADQGHLKRQAADLARRDDLPHEPSSSHYHAARHLINRTRGTGWRGDLPSAEQRFASRAPITESQRRIFERLVENQLRSESEDAQQALDARLGQASEAAQQGDTSAPVPVRKIPSDVLHRRAVAEAMKAFGLYETRRRRVRLPLPARMSA